jgi:3-dehydroquinate dehydratase-2
VKILIINGPNLNMLGKRSQKHYGSLTLQQINNYLKEYFQSRKIDLLFFQSNYEGEIIDKLQKVDENINGIIINPGALTHYSYAIRDALEIIRIPIIEVHLSNIYNREGFRSQSVTASVCNGQLSGLGYKGYKIAVEAIVELLEGVNND